MEAVLLTGKPGLSGAGGFARLGKEAVPAPECSLPLGSESVLGSLYSHSTSCSCSERGGPRARRVRGYSSESQLGANGLPEVTLGNNFRSPSSFCKW